MSAHLLAVAALFAGCTPAPAASSSLDGAAVVVLTADDAGIPVTLTVGQRVAVSLGANRTTGYGWSVADAAGGALVQDGKAAYLEDPPQPGMVGIGGVEEITLRAVRAGAGTLRLVYRRPFEPDAAPAETFAVLITVR